MSNIPAGQSDSSLEQLLKVVGTLSERVRGMNKIKGSSQRYVGAVVAGRQVWGGVSREDMRIELKELQEQERRQCSVVLRGFNSNNQDLARRKFVDICELLGIGHRAEWIDWNWKYWVV